MFIVEQKLVDQGQMKFGPPPPSIFVISPLKPWNFLGDGSIYESRASRHKENIP